MMMFNLLDGNISVHIPDTGTWSYRFKLGTMSREHLERIAKTYEDLEIDLTMPLDSRIDDEYQTITFNYKKV